jgi:transcriptional regulator with XRE-family HTH domain
MTGPKYAESARFAGVYARIVAAMDTNERLRQRVLRLIKQGVNQKVLANAMKIDPGTFSRWISGKAATYEPRVSAIDGLANYERELLAALGQDQETQRSAAAAADQAPAAVNAAGPPFPDRRRLNLGPPSGVPDRRRPSER